MTNRERRRKMHGIVAALIQSFIDRDEGGVVDWDERDKEDHVLETMRDYHYRLGDETPEGT